MAYNAPETAKFSEYSYPSDIWSFGVTLYELMVGSLPDKVEPSYVQILKNKKQLVVPEESLANTAFWDLVYNCLIFDPSKRITTDNILKHPFCTGKSVVPSPYQPPAYYPVKRSKPSQVELLAMINTDFYSFVENYYKSRGVVPKMRCRKVDKLDPYTINCADEPLGNGGWSTVYKAFDTSAKRTVALKFFKMEKISCVKVANLLLGEIEIMQELSNSPFNIRLMDYFVYQNTMVLALEYCDGGSLTNYVRCYIREKKQSLPVNELRCIAWNIGCGLNDMHSLSIMHRDVKSDNALLIKGPDMRLKDVKLCDYGFGKKLSEGEALVAQTLLGTTDYMAPELMGLINEKVGKGVPVDNKQKSYTGKIDVWAYGILLYFAAYGKTPRELSGGAFSLFEGNVKFPPDLAVPEDYKALIKECLMVNYEERPDFSIILQNKFFRSYIPSIPCKQSIQPYQKGAAISIGPAISVYNCKKGITKYTMKIVNVPFSRTVESMKRYYESIRTMDVLKSAPNVAHLVDYFFIRDQLHHILEYIENTITLEDFVKKSGSSGLSYSQQRLIAFYLLKGIYELHRRNVIHRGLDPKNILVGLDSTCKTAISVYISEFGSSRILCENESAETINFCGSYVCPEILQAQEKKEEEKDSHSGYKAAADIWSYGMILYYIMFRTEAERVNGNTRESMYTHGKFQYMPGAKVDTEVLNLMHRCLNPNPKERPSAEELLKGNIFCEFAKKV